MELDFGPLNSRDLAVSSLRVNIREIGIFNEWLKKGQNGTMDYLERRDGILKREDPSLLSRNSKSIILFLMNYKRRSVSREGYGRIASYAVFKDYHKFMPKMIERIMNENLLYKEEYKIYVDTGPLLERGLAADSSIGWIGRNSMLINRAIGSFTFIGAAVSDLALSSKVTPSPDMCGTCHRCIESCPTGAINHNRTVDANKCISYQTIENRGVIPNKIALNMSDMIFGCDICNDVCPWNNGKPDSSIIAVKEDQFSNKMKLEDIAYLDRETFQSRYGGSAITRTSYSGMARNATVALFNNGDVSIVKDVSRTFNDVRKSQADELLEFEKT